MRYRRLGKTGLEVSEVGFGAIPIIRLSFAEAEQVLRRALERGINFYDTAHLYVDSEEKIGRAFAGQRRQVLLASKTMKRDRQGAREDLELSLRRLGTDYLDLYQLHQVSQDSDWETLTGPDGALDTSPRPGKPARSGTWASPPTAWKWPSGWSRPDFSAPSSFPSILSKPRPLKLLHPLARRQQLGILAMKPFCGGLVEDARVAFAFLRQFPDIIPLAGCDSVAQSGPGSRPV